jgi:predicted lipoprotein with Yx(FWY)xxD motif
MHLSRSRGLGLIALALSLAALGTACSKTDNTAPAAKSGATSGAIGAAGAVAIRTGDSNLGKILTGPDGRTVYGFTNDTNATSTCFSTCAQAWPPVTVPASWSVAPGLDTGIFSTISRPDGQLQLVVGKWPLYFYSGDSGPGVAQGQGSGDVWFVVGPDGKLITQGKTPGGNGAAYPGGSPTTGAPATGGPAATTAMTKLGTVLVDSKQLTLYGFTKDTAGTPTCAGACATAWPAMLVDSAALPAGLDPKVFSVVKRADGGYQLKAGKWPLYRYAGDQGPGDTNGQASGGVWFVVSPAGKLIKS